MEAEDDPENQTSGRDFILLRLFSSSHTSLVFSSLFIIFILTVTEYALLILLIHRDSRLHSPVYFLLNPLSFIDILLISNIIPKVITNFLSGTRTISSAWCGYQVFLYVTWLGDKCHLLAAMSYVCYMAICHPLSYVMLMSDSVSVLLAVDPWLVETLNSIVHKPKRSTFPSVSLGLSITPFSMISVS
ncbi:Olfactory receptor 2AJ1 [Heterocephalus glaber]|uniref:Olfactory receptor 2AJ1 n=1 Tax=Heterocephalus glaber TaxID=10181 RepID=G5C7P6_HETGA|nr:Olfactory receptor 2AJ1 [Heterocephalus glaber]